jgi:iron complex transport system substrate-binding protein
MQFDLGFRIDLLVERSVVVEVKSLDRVAPIHRKQLLTYLRLTDLRVGLLLNFGADTMKEGITRVVNEF